MDIESLLKNPHTKYKTIFAVIVIQISLAFLISNHFKLDPIDCREMHRELDFCLKITNKKFKDKRHIIFGRKHADDENIVQVTLPEVDDLYDSLSTNDWVIKIKGDTLFKCLHVGPDSKIYSYVFAPYCRRYYPCLSVDSGTATRRKYDSLESRFAPVGARL